MKRTPLVKWLEKDGNNQTDLAAKVGLTQGAISRMVREARAVFVIQTANGIELEEVRTPGKRRAQ